MEHLALLSDDLVLSRSLTAAIRQSPVLRDHRGDWAAPTDMVILPAAQAQLLSPTIHMPARAVTKRAKLTTSLRFRDKLTGDDLVAFAEHLVNEPEKASAFEALLKNSVHYLTPSVVKGLRAIPCLKLGHSERILALLKREDFRTAVDLLVYDYRRQQGSVRTLRQRDVLDRLGSIERVRFVTGIDRRFDLGGKTVAITTEAAAVDGEITLRPTRTKFEFEQNLTYALAELLGATQVSDARKLSIALLPLLM